LAPAAGADRRIGGTFARYGGFSAHFSLLYGGSRPDSRVEGLFRAVLPHLTRAAQTHQRLLDAAAQREALEGGFDRLSIGLILTDAAADAVRQPTRRGGAAGRGRCGSIGAGCWAQGGPTDRSAAPADRPGSGRSRCSAGASGRQPDPGRRRDGRQTSLLVVPASRNASVLSVSHPKVMIFVVTPAAARSRPRRICGSDTP